MILVKSVIFINGHDYLSNQDICNAISAKLNSPIIYIHSKKALMEFDIYDVMGFGIGINIGNRYQGMLKFVEKLPNVQNKKAFIFSTNKISSDKNMKKDHETLLNLLENKGFAIINDFNCKGFNTSNILKCINDL